MKRLECMDGLRGVLAVYVMIGHMAPFAPLPPWLAHPLSHGGAAVDMFFILSGLVITGSLEKFHYRTLPFLIARVARIFPVYVVVFLGALLIQTMPHDLARMPWVAPDSPARLFWSEGLPRSWPVDVLAHLTMTHGLFPDGLMPDIWVSILGAAWSLSTEWQFYVLALLLARRLAPRGEVAVRLAWLLIGLGVAGVIWAWLAPPPWQFSRAFAGNKAAYFGLGVMSAVVLRSNGGFRPAYAAALAATLLVILGHGNLGKLLPPLAWTLCLAAQMAPAGTGSRRGARWSPLPPLARALRSRPAQVLGAWSYGIYLVNEPVQELFGITLADWAEGNATVFTLLWLPGAILLPIAVAALLHGAIELPGQAWGRRLIARLPGTVGGLPVVARRIARP